MVCVSTVRDFGWYACVALSPFANLYVSGAALQFSVLLRWPSIGTVQVPLPLLGSNVENVADGKVVFCGRHGFRRFSVAAR